MNLKGHLALWDLSTCFSYHRAYRISGLPGRWSESPKWGHGSVWTGFFPLISAVGGRWLMVPWIAKGVILFVCPLDFVLIQEQTTFSRKSFACWKNNSVVGTPNIETEYCQQSPYFNVYFSSADLPPSSQKPCLNPQLKRAASPPGSQWPWPAPVLGQLALSLTCSVYVGDLSLLPECGNHVWLIFTFLGKGFYDNKC